jgi:hypothetical protein
MKFNILILFLIFSSRLMSQNLVPDPTFDMPFDCSRPYFSFYGIPWYTPNKKSSDSYHECKRDILGTVPYNAQGYQKPASGKGYAGIRTIIAWEGMAPDLPYREYISSKLSGKLEKDWLLNIA